MRLPAPAQVTVELRALDTGDRRERAFRLSRAVGEEGVSFRRDLPWEAGRPVSVELRLPVDDQVAIRAVGRIVGVAPEDEQTEGERARPRAVAFTTLDEAARARLAAYVEERTLLP